MMDKIKIPKGTIIKLSGIPLELAQDTICFGNKDNFILSKGGQTGRNNAKNKQPGKRGK